MGGETDVLQWLLPEASLDEQEHARRLITFLRLLRDDGLGRRTGGVGLELGGARAELERVGRSGLLVLCEELLRFHLGVLLPGDSWGDFGRPGLGLQTVWSRLESLRGQGLEVPAVPAPGEHPAEVARRVLALARRTGATEPWLALWEARHAQGTDPRSGVRVWREVLDRADQGGWAWGMGALALAGLVRARLDSGDVRGAKAELEARLALVAIEGELAWLGIWTALLADDVGLAEELMAGRAPWRGRLPAALVELRERRPSWSRFLVGDPCPHPSAAEFTCEAEPVCSRGTLHASVFGVFVLETDRSLRRLVFDAAPGLREAALRRLEQRDGAWSQPGEPEQQVLVEGRSLLLDRAGDAPLRGALDPGSARSLALAPLRDEEGEPVGWLHVECEHRLLPTRTRLGAIACSWEREARALRAAASTDARELTRSRVAESVRSPGWPDDPRACWAAEIVRRLGVRLARRRVFVFDLNGAAVFESGGALADWKEHRGGARALGRAGRTASSVGFDASQASLAVHAEAGSGLAVPVRLRDRVCAVFVVESKRRGDFSPAFRSHLERLLREGAWSWRAACFRTWHRAQFGEDVFFEPNASAWRERMGELLALARARRSLTIVGPEGAGKETLARWFAFEGESAERQIEVTRVPDPGALAVHVPALCDRRDEIPGLVRVLCDRIARRERVPEPSFSDDALALLWRQAWPGNVCELEAFLTRVVVSAGGEIELGSADLLAQARLEPRRLRKRLPSRRPRAEDVRLALLTTAHRNGAWNKTRAARYLGWDPDTLSARLDPGSR